MFAEASSPSPSLFFPPAHSSAEIDAEKKEDDFSTGPLSVLTQSVRNNTQATPPPLH